MSLRCDTFSLIAGALVCGDRGLGVLAESIDCDASPPPVLCGDFTLPADAGKELRALITTPPVSGSLFLDEDGSFTYSGPPDSFTYQLYVDGVATGDPVVVNLGGAAITGSVALALSASAILDQRRHPALAGSTTVALQPSAVLAYQQGATIAGAATFALQPTAALAYQQHPALAGSVTLALSAAATMAASTTAIVGSATLALQPSAATDYRMHAAFAGSATLILQPTAVMSGPGGGLGAVEDLSVQSITVRYRALGLTTRRATQAI